MDEQYMTELDKLGMYLAAKEVLEERLGLLRARVSRANIAALQSLGDLLKRDAAREKDGFLPKIKFRRILAGPGKVIVVPFVEEERLVHGDFEPKEVVKMAQSLDDGEDDGDLQEGLGHGEGDVGEVIGEVPLPLGGGDGGDGGGSGQGPGAGEEPDDHGFEEEAYEIGKRLMEKLQLPNLREKRKKVPTEEYVYDLTDRHDGAGQLLDEEATLERIVETSLVLGRVNKDRIDPTKLIVSPEDEVYRVLARERLWKSQAVVFFIRDYSGSMWGEPTQILVAQHLMIYAWLLVQYERMVVPKFIVHDTLAREVSAREYFGLSSGGGTLIASGYKEINKIVESEGLADRYNIYVFQGTDGDDFDRGGKHALPELGKILQCVNRMGVCLFKHPYYAERNMKTTFEDYIEQGGILARKDVFRMHTLPNSGVTEEQHIGALKVMIAQD